VQVLTYVAWGAAFFFAGSWTFGLLVRPDYRLKSTVASLLLWWLEIGLALLGFYSPLHLFWLMPISLFLPNAYMQAEIRSRLESHLSTILLKSSVIIGPVLGLLIYFSR